MKPPVYLVNLPKDADRKAHSLTELDKCGLGDALVCSDAVLGRALSPEQRAQVYDEGRNARRYHKTLSAGEIGCYKSHLDHWQRIVEAGAPLALVIEDDVVLTEQLVDAIATVAARGVAFDMIKLIGRPRESVLRRQALSPTLDLIEYFRVPSFTGAYLVSLQGARKLLAARQRFFRSIDVDLRFWWEVDRDFLLYGLQPYPVGHAHFVPSLGPRPPSRHGALKHRWLKTVTNAHAPGRASVQLRHPRRQLRVLGRVDDLRRKPGRGREASAHRLQRAG